MAVLFSVQSGDWTTSTTWKVVDPISFANTETSGTTLTTSFQTSNTFTPGAITVEGIAVKVSSRPNVASGTITVRLSTGGVAVTGTTVTINVSDLPLTTFSSPTSFYWCYFKFASPVTLLAATLYAVQATTSVSTQVSLGYSTTTTNWIRCLVTSTNATPASTDTLIVAGEHTAAGIGADYTVTVNNTSSTVFGSASGVFPALEIGRRGIVNFGVSSSTTYQLICNGNINIGGGGILNIGTAGSPIPETSSALIQFRVSSANQFQINVRQFGNLYTCGAYKNAKDILAASASAGVTSVTTTTTTNWNSGDNICIAPAVASTSLFDQRGLSTTASSTTLTFTASLTNTKNVWPGTEVEVINLTRNVRIIGSSSTFDCLHTYNGQVNVDLRNTEFRYSAWANSVTETTNTSTLNFQGLSFWDMTQRSIITDSSMPSGGGSVSWSDCVFHNCNTFTTVPTATSPSSFSIDDCWGIRCTGASWIILNGNNTATINNCRWIGSAASGIQMGNNVSFNNGPIIITNNIMKCNVNGFSVINGAYTTIPKSHNLFNNTIYFNTTVGLNLSPVTGNMNGWTFRNLNIFSNATANISVTNLADVTIISATMTGGPTSRSAIGVRLVSTDGLGVTFDNCHMSTHSTADISNGSGGVASFNAKFRNCAFRSSTQIQNQSTMQSGSLISSQRHNQTDNNYLIWEPFGTLSNDTVIFRNSSPSIKMGPLSLVNQLETRPILVPVKDGQIVTVGVWVRTSVGGDVGGAYNGNFPRLISKANSSNGTGTFDLVLATASAASSGFWEYISGTLPQSIDNTAFEIVVDCDGTNGFVNVDDMYISAQNSTKGFKYWYDGSPVPTSTTQNGSAVIFL